MAKDINTLRQEAQQVQNATQVGENTAQRVGGVLTDIVDKAEEHETDIDNLNANTGIDDYTTFSESTAYNAGDVVNYQGKLYKFTADHAVGAWTGSDVEPYNLKKDIEERYGTYTDSPEFINVVTDAEGKFLWGIRIDGSIEWAKGIPTPVQNAIRELEDKLKTQDIKSLQDAIDVINASLKTLTDTFSYQDNPEFINVVTDSDGKVLFGIKTDGIPYYPNNEMYRVIQNDEYLAAWVDASNKVLFGIKTDGTKYFSKQALLDKYDDVEGRTEMTIDAEDKVLAYRDKLGIKHEEKLALHEVYDKDNNKLNLATKEDMDNVTVDPSDINISELDGVSNHNTPNLLIADEMQKTFNDGTNSFTPPNAGYEMSNPIECQAGDWFTRTGTATGMVVVTDEHDKNGTRLFNADGTTLGNTFQIPEDMTWVRYIRMAAEVGGATDGSVVICKGKKAYTGSERGNFLTIDKLMVQQNNIPKDIKYLQTSDGRYWELYVDEIDFSVKVKEVDPDIITNLPSDFKPWTLNGTFDNQFDRMLIQNNNYFIEIKATGVVKYKYIGNIVSGNYANFEHFYSPTGDDRYGFIFLAEDDVIGKGFTLFDGEFNILDTNIGLTGYNRGVSDVHDFIYLADDHILLYSGYTRSVQVPEDTDARMVTGPIVTELKKTGNTWNVIGEFKAVDYPQLCTDAYGELGVIGNVTDSHSNTITLDYDGNLIINCRNWDTFIKVKRTENGDGTVTIGSKTLDYNEAIIGRVGGRHNSGYLDSKRVLNDGFSFTDTPAALNEVSDDAWEEWQWFHCHDVKYWGMKQIGDKQYPTYTLFDNNYWTNSEFVSGQYNTLNKNNNVNINPKGAGNYYLTANDSDENYAKYTHSRIVQVSIDWENHKIMDYRVYYIPKLYSREQSGATMYDEGVISIAYSYAGEFGLWDFTTGETEISGHIYKGAKKLFHGKYSGYRVCYRVNTYKLNV